MGRIAAALVIAVEWTSRTPRVGNETSSNNIIRQLSEQEGARTQVGAEHNNAGRVYMGLISGAHRRGMNWRRLWHEYPGGARRFARLLVPSKT